MICNTRKYSVILKYTFRIEVLVKYFIIEKIEKLRPIEENKEHYIILVITNILPMAP